MLDTGLRLSEIARLSIDDVSEEGTLRVFGKGRKWRTVALGTTSATAQMNAQSRHTAKLVHSTESEAHNIGLI
jgi:site-specific recombinase XerD